MHRNYNQKKFHRRVFRHALTEYVRFKPLLGTLLLSYNFLLILQSKYSMQPIDHCPAKYKVGDEVSVSVRYPIGHYRVPMYMRGKRVKVERVLGHYVNPEEEGFGRNAGDKTWCYLVTIDQKNLWPAYAGHPIDRLEIEIFEPWLESIKTTTHEQ